MTKVTELIKSAEQFSYSFEVTPDVSEEEIDALDVDPLFFSITWHAKSHQCKNIDISSLRTAKMLRSKQKHVLLHISCDMMKEEYLKEILEELRKNNICNLFLILGENYDPELSEFQNTVQLIKFIRQHSGNFFCIGVAGFPGCSEEKMAHMKNKVENGADFIITQAFFDVNLFQDFVQRLELMNVNVPVIPGVFPFESCKQLNGFINLCKIKVSGDLLEYLRVNEERHTPCFEVVERLMKELNKISRITHFHYFTLNNLQRVINIVRKIAL